MITAVYLLQKEILLYDEPGRFHVHPYVSFAINKTARLILNDLACLLIISAVFQRKQYLRLAWYIFLLELTIVLPIYLVVKLTLEGNSEISSPLLSQVHRLIVNPVLMLLLMIGFVYQKTMVQMAGK